MKSGVPLDQKQVLVVEDSSAVRKILSLRLKRLGATTLEAGDGRQALDVIHSHSVDLVLSDVDMPILDGLELCRKLKEDEQTRQLPIILISLLDSKSDQSRGYEAGAASYISKNVSDDELQANIVQVMEKASRQRQSTILVVDDSLTMLKLVETGLSQAGFNVITAKNGLEGQQQLSRRRPDIIVSDLDMPQMNGLEFLDWLLATPEFAQIPFMIMSANSEKSVMLQMVRKGAAAYMVKPFNLDQFVFTVERVLSEQFQLILRERERLAVDRNGLLNTITSLIQALEARDSYTSGHSKRVAEYSKAIGIQLGLTETDLETLLIGGKLHDVGKIGIPDGLLLKPGKLTEVEVSTFRFHPSIGADILKPIPSLGPMIDVVLLHHERIDGLGYPNGLKGGDIPLLAKICGVADCFDALTSDRPYRKGFDQKKAFDIIREASGTQLCSTCVEAFFDANIEVIL